MVDIDILLKINSAALDGVKKTVDNIKQSAAGIKDSISTNVGKGIDMFKQKLGSLKDTINESVSNIPVVGQHISKFTSALGLTGVAIGAVAAGFVLAGTHMIEVTKELEETKKAFRGVAEGKELDLLVAKTKGIQSQFGVTSEEIASTVNVLKNEFGIGGAHAIDLIKKGLVATNGSLDLEQIKEYAGQLAQTEANAEDLLTIAVKSNQIGLFNDKGLDSFKEFGLRIREQTKPVEDALKLAGLDSKKIFADINSGAKGEIQTFEEIFKNIDKMPRNIQQALITNLGGGPLEDLGINGIKQLANLDGGLDKLVTAQGAYTENQMEAIRLNEILTEKQQAYASSIAPFLKQIEIVWLNVKIAFESIIGAIFNSWKGVYRLWESFVTFYANTVKKIIPEGWLEGLSNGFGKFFSFVGGKLSQFADLVATIINIVNEALRGNYGTVKEQLTVAKKQTKDLFSWKLPEKAKGVDETNDPSKMGDDKTSLNADASSNISNGVSGVSSNTKNIYLNIEAFQRIGTQTIEKTVDIDIVREEVNKQFMEVANDINNV